MSSFDSWYINHRQCAHEWLHDLHMHPERGFEEVRTAAFVAKTLESFGYEVVTGVGGTGVVGTLKGMQIPAGSPGRCIAFRAELDALPMQEQSSVKYKSRVDGVFHGCGHDGHSVTLLTAAKYIAEHAHFMGTVRVIFQPAEELLSGAQSMIDDGLFDRFPCDEIYALHNLPGLKSGHIDIPAMEAMASSDNIDIKISGNGTHSATPHNGEDTVLAAAALITNIQQAATRVTDARDAGVVSFGKIAGGTARNVLPDSVEIAGTLRSNAQSTRERLSQLIQDAVAAVETIYKVHITLGIKAVAPIAMNNALTSEAVAMSAGRIVGVDKVSSNARSLMASEDFAVMQREVPGTFFFVGQDGYFPHHPEFVFDTNIIPVGAAIFVDLANSRGNTQLNSQ